MGLVDISPLAGLCAMCGLRVRFYTCHEAYMSFLRFFVKAVYSFCVSQGST